jgi:hypothetical protein
MQTKKIFLFFTLSLLMNVVYAQHKNNLRLSANYAGSTGLSGSMGYERMATQNLGLLAQLDVSAYTTYGSLGFRYKLLSYKDKVSLNIGADVGYNLVDKHREMLQNPFVFIPTIELRVKLTNRLSMIGTYRYVSQDQHRSLKTTGLAFTYGF